MTIRFIGSQPDPQDRIQIQVSDVDASRIDRLKKDGKEKVTVRDGFSGRKVTVKSAPCGLGCHCALAFTR